MTTIASTNPDAAIAAVQDIAALLVDVRGCTVCAAHLPLGPRPIIQVSSTARLVIIGQAPGARVHASGVPWDDASGERLREWTGLTPATFYDPAVVALIPMGFCYPGAKAGADLPPRPECAPLWHERLLSCLPQDHLALLVGGYAQRRYLGAPKGQTLTESVRKFAAAPTGVFPLPHPSWRSGGWMTRNPWFEREVLPALRAAINAVQ